MFAAAQAGSRNSDDGAEDNEQVGTAGGNRCQGEEMVFHGPGISLEIVNSRGLAVCSTSRQNPEIAMTGCPAGRAQEAVTSMRDLVVDPENRS